MANELLVTSLPTVNQYDVNRAIIQPIFMGQDYMQYMEVLPNIKGTTVIDKFNQLGKITKAFAQGEFSGETISDKGATVTITPARVEAEIQFRANELFNKMKGQLMRGGHEFDNVDGTIVKNILLDLIGQGIKADFNRQLWLSDAAEADANYGIYDGIFQVAKEGGAYALDNASVSQANGEALGSGKGLTILKALYDFASPELLEAGDHVYFVSGDIADDYMAATLESSNFAAAGYGALVNGVPQLTYRGIPIIVRRDWDVAIAADVSEINGCNHATETHRAMLTTRGAFVVGTDFDENSIEQWYSQDHKAYRFRVAYMVGVALKDAKLATYYTPDEIAV
jgi:hypothetical protein|tara:strand:- start:203 stop:1222 length:1020 start_codon:yes stop_codon:yes gene_type:complete